MRVNKERKGCSLLVIKMKRGIPQWGGGRRACVVTPGLSYIYGGRRRKKSAVKIERISENIIKSIDIWRFVAKIPVTDRAFKLRSHRCRWMVTILFAAYLGLGIVHRFALFTCSQNEGLGPVLTSSCAWNLEALEGPESCRHSFPLHPILNVHPSVEPPPVSSVPRVLR